MEAEQRRKTSGVCWWVSGVSSYLTENRMSVLFSGKSITSCIKACLPNHTGKKRNYR
ncbi:hypothetical protein HanRHA438_Chr00c15g0850091 [Helianthus annuus]|nr:hypothetical protein HanRHA438_Chr00c15g0850091 [Helianthus annuus]